MHSLFLLNEIIVSYSFVANVLMTAASLVDSVAHLSPQGALVTVTNDDHLHLWNLRQKQPSIVHSLKFQREK